MRLRSASSLSSFRYWGMPAFLWLAILCGLPLVLIFFISLAHRDPQGTIVWSLSLTNYFRAVAPIYLSIYWRSLSLAILTVFLCFIFSFPVALFIVHQRRQATKHLLVFLVTLPFWTSFLVRTYAWIILLRTEGIINNTLLQSGAISEPLPMLYNNFAVVVGLVYGELPFMILPLYTALERIDKSLLEASADLGCGAGSTFFRVLLPLSRPGLIAGIVLVFVPSLGAFITPDLLGGAKSMMAGNLIQSQFAVARNQPFGSAVACLLTILVLILLALSYRTVRQTAELA